MGAARLELLSTKESKNINTHMKTKLIALLVAASALLFTASTARAQVTNVNTNAITCDFTALVDAIDDLDLSDIQAPNDHARQGRLNSLENAVEAAQEAADDGDIEDVLEALQHIANKAGSGKNAWIRDAAAADINDALDELMDCLSSYIPDDDDDEDED